MKNTKTILLVLSVVLLLGTGCAKKEIEQVPDEPTVTGMEYIVKVRTGLNGVEQKSFFSETDTELGKIVEELQLEIKSQMQDKEVITELDGILSTQLKKWILYINGEEQEYNEGLVLAPDTIIEFRYEKI